MLSFVTGALNPCVTDVAGRAGTKLAELCISCGVHVITTLPGPAGYTQLWDSLGLWFFPCRATFLLGRELHLLACSSRARPSCVVFLGLSDLGFQRKVSEKSYWRWRSLWIAVWCGEPREMSVKL